MFRDGMRESADGFVEGGSEGLDREPFESLHQRMTEAVQPISVADDALALDVVQYS